MLLLFASAGLKSSTSAYVGSGISALLKFIVTISAFLFADRWDHATCAIVVGLAQVVRMFSMGWLCAVGTVHAHSGVARWIVVATNFLFTVISSAMWGVSFRVCMSEIQSPKTRAGAASLALSTD